MVESRSHERNAEKSRNRLRLYYNYNIFLKFDGSMLTYIVAPEEERLK